MFELVSGFPFHERIVGCYDTMEKAQKEVAKYEIARIIGIEVE